MKKFIILLIIAISLSVTTADAQKKGDTYAGGNLKFALSTSGSNGYMNTGTYFSIAPEIGHFITDKVKIGGEISYEVSSNAHVVALMPNIAYYQPVIRNLYYTPQLNIGGGVGIYSGYVAGIFTLTLNIASFEYRPTERLGIAMGLVNLNYNLIDKTKSINFNVLYSPSVSFRCYF
jgi:hypothetical protein